MKKKVHELHAKDFSSTTGLWRKVPDNTLHSQKSVQRIHETPRIRSRCMALYLK
jgi:hypothetical protein